ncbi:type 4a pilus biogenesis protein PilO [Candidatus Albibeggiatoa sp. nov. NOAA]|uniref:type 4a pilus biogenesis protein PilO n=1 Tax=Candidatus Albibeggiatoa sp. nov. NOAA TaxID=3162724 RepID=UPI0032F98E51|nr:type 4a pilus biogenesis protein PilO [Thiotrichaceae bacterium]
MANLKIDFEEFKNLDPNNVGSWPVMVKAAIVLGVFIAALVGGYYFDTKKQQTQLSAEERKEVELRDKFKQKQWEAATLPKLQEQLREIESNLEDLQNRLPNKAQVAGLIQDISQQAIATGLSSELFKPGREEVGQVYVKLPITLRLNGDYHSFGNFVSGIAAMPRIVTQHNISIETSSSRNSDKPLTMEMTAQIYRYLDESEAQ